MANCLHYVTGSRFPLGANHGRALTNTAQCFAQITCPAYERYFELGFINMVDIVGRGEYFGFVDIVDLDSF